MQVLRAVQSRVLQSSEVQSSAVQSSEVQCSAEQCMNSLGALAQWSLLGFALHPGAAGIPPTQNRPAETFQLVNL